MTLSALPRGDSVKRPISESSSQYGTVNTFYSDIQNIDEISNRSETKSVIDLPVVSQIGFSYNGQDLGGMATKRPTKRGPDRNTDRGTNRSTERSLKLNPAKRSKTTTNTASTSLVVPEPMEFQEDWKEEEDANKLMAIKEVVENHSESEEEEETVKDHHH